MKPQKKALFFAIRSLIYWGLLIGPNEPNLLIGLAVGAIIALGFEIVTLAILPPIIRYVHKRREVTGSYEDAQLGLIAYESLMSLIMGGLLWSLRLLAPAYLESVTSIGWALGLGFVTTITSLILGALFGMPMTALFAGTFDAAVKGCLPARKH